MIHVFVTCSDDASDSLRAHAVRELGIAHRVSTREQLLRCRRRVWLHLVELPLPAMFPLRAAPRSQVRDRPAPEAVVARNAFAPAGAMDHYKP